MSRATRRLARSLVLGKGQARAVGRSSYLLWKKRWPQNGGIRRKRSIGRSLFSSRVDKTGSQSRVISKSRCRAKLHSIFKHAQRQSRDGRFFLLLGGSDQLVGNQIARLSLHLEW